MCLCLYTSFNTHLCQRSKMKDSLYRDTHTVLLVKEAQFRDKQIHGFVHGQIRNCTTNPSLRKDNGFN